MCNFNDECLLRFFNRNIQIHLNPYTNFFHWKVSRTSFSFSFITKSSKTFLYHFPWWLQSASDAFGKVGNMSKRICRRERVLFVTCLRLTKALSAPMDFQQPQYSFLQLNSPFK
jgi:hypothetical protein